MYRLFLLGVCIVVLAGCAKLKHIDQLLTLKAMSEEKDAMDKEVSAHNTRFAAMVEQAQKDGFKRFKNKRAVRREFGNPVAIQQIDEPGREEEWLYRNATEYFNTDKVFLYFDEEHQLVDWTYLPKAEETQQTP